MQLNAHRIVGETGQTRLNLLAIENVTGRAQDLHPLCSTAKLALSRFPPARRPAGEAT
jgi:hypothetical protein